ncbi:MAG: hypothetical protein CMJ84_10350 [Planctomycetes bacterium]|jgi:RNA polymerase sigma factor (sigma-70 family)|nr:hypothetical protein [Planctomycetota bacterium]MDP6409379.1 ECF-type sigma factor [Planctomycetota bacterium]
MEHPQRLIDLALQHLGPVTARMIAGEGTCLAFERTLEQGADEIDALLSTAYSLARQNRAVAGEFLQHFMSMLLASPDAVPGHDLRNIVDPQDLVQSVVGDVLPLLSELEFQSRGQFLSLLIRRLNWKRVDKIRLQRTAARGGDWRRKSVDPDAQVPRRHRTDPLTPLSAMICAEQEERLVLAMHELGADDQRILRAGMTGATSTELAKLLGCSPGAARKRAQRARDRLRDRVRPTESSGDGGGGAGDDGR